MPEVDWIVHMSYGISVPSKVSVGTQGCGPCLGIIIELNSRVICIHMSSDFIPKNTGKVADQPEFFRQHSQLVKIVFELWGSTKIPGVITSLHLTSSMPDPSTKAMYAGTNLYFKRNEPLGRSDGIYWNGKEVKLLQGGFSGEALSGKNKTDGEDNSGKGPFNILKDGKLPAGMVVEEKA
jgi:hypothetical protein